MEGNDERADVSGSEWVQRVAPTAPFVLASRQRTLVVESAAHVAEPSCDEAFGWDAALQALLAETRPPRGGPQLVAGALPFDRAQKARLIVPARARWYATPSVVACPVAPPIDVAASRDLPAAQAYLAALERAIARIRAGQLNKVVLSRSIELDTTRPVEIGDVLCRLMAKNPRAYTFAVNLSCRNGGPGSVPTEALVSPRTLVGASPELLVSRTGCCVTANPLAGSAPRSGDPVEDRRLASALLNSAKDLREHAFVVEAVAEALRPFCSELSVPSAPSLICTPVIWHLSTRINGWLKDRGISSLQLAEALHPTPAVCGTPTPSAIRAIRELEGRPRGFYTGLVGWCDATGDGEWIIALRCGVIQGRHVTAYAGGGIVAASQPEAELEETTVKLGTFLHGLGVPLPEPRRRRSSALAS